MLSRETPPSYTTDFKIKLPKIQSIKLSNGIPLHTLYSDLVEVFRLEIVFPIGILHAPTLTTATFLSRIISQGTTQRNALQIAEDFEKLGGFFDIQTGNYRTTFTLHGMTQNLEKYIEIVLDVIYNPSFPDNELEIQKAQSIQGIQVGSQKTSYQASKAFKKAMFGTKSILGQNLEIEDINSLTVKDLQEFYKNRFIKTPFDLFLCGNFSQSNLNFIQSTFEKIDIDISTKYEYKFPEQQEPQNIKIDVENSVQSTLILGKRLFNRTHPDFFKFLVTNTIFGGYFGSRLMKNIREEKGLTYGISSGLQANGIDGVFSIKAELKTEKLEEALTEINKELEILKNDLCSDAELQTVKNYIKGNILSGTNTLFDIMDKHKAIKYENLNSDFYEQMVEHIENVSAEDVKNMAQKYLNNFSTIIAG